MRYQMGDRKNFLSKGNGDEMMGKTVVNILLILFIIIVWVWYVIEAKKQLDDFPDVPDAGRYFMPSKKFWIFLLGGTSLFAIFRIITNDSYLWR